MLPSNQLLMCLCVCQRGVSEDKDMYEEYLTQREIQNHIRTVNGEQNLRLIRLYYTYCFVGNIGADQHFVVQESFRYL